MGSSLFSPLDEVHSIGHGLALDILYPEPIYR